MKNRYKIIALSAIGVFVGGTALADEVIVATKMGDEAGQGVITVVNKSDFGVSLTVGEEGPTFFITAQPIKQLISANTPVPANTPITVTLFGPETGPIKTCSFQFTVSSGVLQWHVSNVPNSRHCRASGMQLTIDN